MNIFVQNRGMQKFLPQAYNLYSKYKISSITKRLGEKRIFINGSFFLRNWLLQHTGIALFLVFHDTTMFFYVFIRQKKNLVAY